MLCSAAVTCEATSTESTPASGRAPCAPRPSMSMSKKAPPAIIGPARTANFPSGMPGRLCMPKMASQGKRLNRPSSTIALAPPRPSSAGWKMKFTVPSKFFVAARYLAAPSSIVVWPSWPQACMRPACFERCANRFASSIGRQSMSARRPMLRFVDPARSTPTMPVLPTPRWTSTPNEINCDATRSEVRASSKPSSGCAWMSRRQAVISPASAAMRGSSAITARIRPLRTGPPRPCRRRCTSSRRRTSTPRRLPSMSAWPTRREPVTPYGWPTAIAPPSTLSRSLGMPSLSRQ